MQAGMLVPDPGRRPLDEDAVHPSSFSVHADRNVVAIQDAGELLTGELTLFVGVDDLKTAISCRGFHLVSKHGKPTDNQRPNAAFTGGRSKTW